MKKKRVAKILAGAAAAALCVTGALNYLSFNANAAGVVGTAEIGTYSAGTNGGEWRAANDSITAAGEAVKQAAEDAAAEKAAAAESAQEAETAQTAQTAQKPKPATQKTQNTQQTTQGTQTAQPLNPSLRRPQLRPPPPNLRPSPLLRRHRLRNLCQRLPRPRSIAGFATLCSTARAK